MEQFAALLVPLLFGGMLFTNILDSDEEEIPEPEPEPQPTTLGEGDDSFTGTDAADNVIANAGFQGNVDGGAGNDTLSGHGTPTSEATPRVTPDSVEWWADGTYSNPPDVISGVIALRGGAGDDQITATGAGIDVDGGEGADRLDLRGMTQGIVNVGQGDSVDVPTGADTQILWTVGQDANLDLTGAGAAQIVPIIGTDASVTGTAHDDRMTTEGDGVTLRGGDGNDTLIGNFDSYINAPTSSMPYEAYLGRGNDLLEGGAGDDRITGDLGDTLTGGAGADSFTVWLDSGSVAYVTDFDPVEDSMTLHVNATAGDVPPGAITTAEVDGNTILRVNGEDRLVIEGRTGLNIGINREEEGDQIGNDTGYQTLSGANADPSAMNILVERYTPYL